MERTHQENVELFLERLRWADAVLVGAASGLSAAAGLRHFYERDKDFVEHMGDFEARYGFHNSFNGFYHSYPDSESRWAFIARMNSLILEAPTGQVYYELHDMLQGKPYHILTTNQDTQFNRVEPESLISAIQGDWRYLQCSRRCRDELFDAVEPLRAMEAATDAGLRIPSSMIPRCPHCGAELEPWVRSPVFLEGKRYREEYRKVNRFLDTYKDKKLLLLELGVGRMTPMFIQEPFWALTAQLPQAYYLSVNPRDGRMPRRLEQKGTVIPEDIAELFRDAAAQSQKG